MMHSYAFTLKDKVKGYVVLILVVMDDALVLVKKMVLIKKMILS